jgi:tetratricopeptide (TPR) repeat protein
MPLSNNAYRKALKDADRILVTLEDPRNAKALIIKGDAQYNLGDFEHSLISYYRALKHSTTKVCLSDGAGFMPSMKFGLDPQAFYYKER